LQVLSTAARVGVPMSGENALQRYDQWAFDKICDSAFGQSVMAGRLEVRGRLPGVLRRRLVWFTRMPEISVRLGCAWMAALSGA
jgi:hypothetical protein